MKSKETKNAREDVGTAETAAVPREWDTPTLTDVGDLGEVLQAGGGKLSALGGDPGEMRKTMPSG